MSMSMCVFFHLWLHRSASGAILLCTDESQHGRAGEDEEERLERTEGRKQKKKRKRKGKKNIPHLVGPSSLCLRTPRRTIPSANSQKSAPTAASAPPPPPEEMCCVGDRRGWTSSASPGQHQPPTLLNIRVRVTSI